ncbi:MAG: SPFH domain-containing protein [Candidatus Thermoplasmatota archaeon]|nr:SPFH domain-containing protein [Candidatus Thermoplasmatota archaeon]
MPQVIQWSSPNADDIIWKYGPEDNIKFGSALVVREWEVAAFLRDGKLFDIFGPGRYMLTTQNLPLITRAYNFLVGYKETPFKADVIFCSKKIFNGHWGIRTMVKAIKDMEAPMPLMVNGDYQFRIEDVSLFITQVVGGLRSYSTAEVNNFLRSFINEKLIQDLSKYTYMDVYSNLEGTSTKTQVNITEPFSQRGLELVALKITGIDTEEEYKKDLYKFQRFRSNAGRDYRQFEVMDKMAESVGKSDGAGIGTGMLLFPQMYQQMTQQQEKVICPHCGAQISATNRFCPACGKEIRAAPPATEQKTKEPLEKKEKGTFNICPYCGKDLNLPKTPKFCPYCKEKF